MSRLIVWSIAILVSISSLCCQQAKNPVQPDGSGLDSSLPEVGAKEDNGKRISWGVWDVDFDTEGMTARVVSVREAEVHLNVTGMIPPPSVVVRGWDPVSNVVSADVTLTNPFSVDGYDVRAIIHIDAAYHYLLNPDCWTKLWDVPGGEEINPFKAYAKGQPNRKFAGHARHTENLQIYLPNGNRNVSFAVDASYPGNCAEPYDIRNFTQGAIYEDVGAMGPVDVEVLDWQGNVSAVNLVCPEITGSPLSPFEYSGGNKWHLDLVNSQGAHYGEYTAWVVGYSSDSGSVGLYQRVIITVRPDLYVPNNPQVISNLFDLFWTYDIEFNGNYAYFADDFGGVKVVDITNPNNLKIINMENLQATDIAMQGNYLYVISNYNTKTMTIYDISNPRSPVKYSELILDQQLMGIDVENNYAYVSKRDEGLIIIDVSDPANPAVLSKIIIGLTRELVYKNGYVYVAREYYGLAIINVMDPANPVIASMIATDYTTGVSVEGNYAYTAQPYGGMKIVDISDPENPSITGTLNVDSVKSTAVRGNYAYVVGKNEMSSVNISDPSSPGIIDSIEIGDGERISLLGNLAYVADGNEGLKVVDISDPANLEIVAQLEAKGGYTTVATSGRYAYTTCNEANVNRSVLRVIDIADPTNPVIITDSNFEMLASSMVINGNYLYVGDWNYSKGIVAINISDPLNPSVTGWSSNGFYMYGMALKGDYIYAADWDNGFRVFSIADPAHPAFVSSFATYSAIGVALKDNYAFVTQYDDDFLVLDISNPMSPQLAGQLTLPKQTRPVAISGDYAFIGAYSTLLVVDITTPENPHVVGSVPTSPNTLDIDIKGNYAYVATQKKLDIFKISNPVNPQLFERIETMCYSEEIVDNYAYVAGGQSGFKIVKLW